MTKRKDDDAIVEFVASFARMPLWVAPVGSVATFVVLAVVLPGVLPHSLLGKTLSTLSTMVAPWLAVAILISGLVGGVDRVIRRAGDRRILGRQVSIDTIRELSWTDFERMLAAAYRDRGYEVTMTPRGADGGVDHILKKEGRTTYLQAKQWKARKVGVEKVRELHGVAIADGVDTSILVTSGLFSDDARAFAERVGMTLVDGHSLMPLVRPFFGGSLSASASVTGSCPVCQADMVVRTARRGSNTGSQFLGCSRYPQCRGTRAISA